MKNDEKSKINFDKVIGTANTGMSTEDIMSFFRNSPLMDRIDLDTARVPACEMREIDTFHAPLSKIPINVNNEENKE